jgi:hypothetical protein
MTPSPHLEIIFRCGWHHDPLIEIFSFLGAGDGITRSWKCSYAKKFITSRMKTNFISKWYS